MATLQQQQKNFLKPGIIALTYQKIATNCVSSKMMQMMAFSVVKPNKRMRANVARIVMDAILLSLLKIFSIWPLNPERKKVPPMARTNPAA